MCLYLIYLIKISWTRKSHRSRDRIKLSFLSGDSVWPSGRDYTQIVAACAEDTLGTQEPSTKCKTSLEKSEKAMLQWQIEGELTAFEKTFCSECE